MTLQTIAKRLSISNAKIFGESFDSTNDLRFTQPEASTFCREKTKLSGFLDNDNKNSDVE